MKKNDADYSGAKPLIGTNILTVGGLLEKGAVDIHSYIGMYQIYPK